MLVKQPVNKRPLFAVEKEKRTAGAERGSWALVSARELPVHPTLLIEMGYFKSGVLIGNSCLERRRPQKSYSWSLNFTLLNLCTCHLQLKWWCPSAVWWFVWVFSCFEKVMVCYLFPEYCHLLMILFHLLYCTLNGSLCASWRIIFELIPWKLIFFPFSLSWTYISHIFQNFLKESIWILIHLVLKWNRLHLWWFE